MIIEDEFDKRLDKEMKDSVWTEDDINPDNFFKENDAGRMVFDSEGTYNELRKKERFIKILGDRAIYFYKDGVWKEGGEEIIKNLLSENMGDKYRHHYTTEVVSFVEGKCLLNGGFEENRELICLENGVLDIENRELKEWSPLYYLTVKLPIKYDPNAMCPNIDKFLSEIVNEDNIDNIKEMFGYCLFRGMPIHRAFILLGDGANGKSTLINLFKSFLGQDNITSISLQNLTGNRFAKGELVNKLANLFADLPDQAVMQTGTFKILTGNDVVGAEKKFGGYKNFTNYAKMIFSCNKLPDAYDITGAFWRRWVLINFPNKFEGESAMKNLILSITTPEELSGLLNVALDGLQNLLDRGEFKLVKSTEDTMNDWKRKANAVWAFVEECLEMDTDGSITKDTLYVAYKEYCEKNSIPPVMNNVFARNLKSEVTYLAESQEKQLDGRRVRVWKGIKLKPIEEPPNDPPFEAIN